MGARKRKPAKRRASALTAAQRLQRSKKASIIANVGRGAGKEAAAAAAGIHRTTLFRWEKDDPAFADGLFNAQMKCVQQVEGALFRNALKPRHTTDRIFYLKTRAGYVERGQERLIELRAGYFEAAMRRQSPQEEDDDLTPFEFKVTARREHKEPDADD